MTTNRAQQLYDSLAERYDIHHVDSKSLAENRYVARYLGGLFGPADTVADLGCGTGLLLELTRVAPERYVGVDISEGMLKQARRKFPEHRFLQGNMEGPMEGLADGSVDVAVSLFGSASYCNVQKVATELRRILKPGGRYFLMYCGPRYARRPSYIGQQDDGLCAYSARQLQEALRPRQLWGMSRVVDGLPGWTPPWAMEQVLKLEMATIGRALQDACYFINVAGSV